MRILFVEQQSVELPLAGEAARQAAEALAAAGQSVRRLVIGRAAGEPPATLPRDCFVAADLELTEYRDQLRRRLDRHVDEFDPHAIICRPLGIEGQLAMETGVPYLVWAVGPDVQPTIGQVGELVQQAVDNFSRAIVANDAIASRLITLYDAASERIVVEPLAAAAHLAAADCARFAQQLSELSEASWRERFGTPPA